MGRRIAIAALVVAGLLTPGMATAVTGSKAPLTQCRIVSGEKLMASSSAAGLCAAVEKAVATAAPAARYRVDVRVMSRSRLSATLVVDGRMLPDQNFAVMDSELNEASLGRFAQSIAAAVAQTAKS